MLQHRHNVGGASETLAYWGRDEIVCLRIEANAGSIDPVWNLRRVRPPLCQPRGYKPPADLVQPHFGPEVRTFRGNVLKAIVPSKVGKPRLSFVQLVQKACM